MYLIRSRLRDNQDLRAGSFAVLRAVGIAEHVELAHSVNSQQLLARSAGLYVVFRRTRKFHAV